MSAGEARRVGLVLNPEPASCLEECEAPGGCPAEAVSSIATMPHVNWLTFLVAAVLFCATLVRSALGFGEALIAVPLLAFVLPVEVVAPVAMLVSITVAAVVVVQDWRHVHLRSAAWLVCSTIVGIPLGLLLLRTVSEPIVKGALGVLVAGFAAFAIRRPSVVELRDDRLAWIFGVSAGVLGGAYGLNGPPLVVYGTLRRWSPDRFRATLQGYFLPASLIGMLGYWIAGLWTESVSRYYLLSLPTVLLAIPLGRAMNRRLDPHRFLFYVHACLLASGAGLVLQAIVR
jgi:uncharacterized protein